MARRAKDKLWPLHCKPCWTEENYAKILCQGEKSAENIFQTKSLNSFSSCYSSYFLLASLDGTFSLEKFKSHLTCRRSRNCLDWFVIFFSFFSFCFFNALQSDNNSIWVYFPGDEYVLGPSRGSFLTFAWRPGLKWVWVGPKHLCACLSIKPTWLGNFLRKLWPNTTSLLPVVWID